MTALATACLDPLFTACEAGRALYAGAARTVGDPGLKLQFNHMATARADVLAEIAAVLGREVVSMEQDVAAPVARWRVGGKVPLGGEVRPRALAGDELCGLVRRLREHDEHLLLQMRQHVDTIPCLATVQVLERAIGVLSQDLDKIRILEALAAGQEGAPATP
ncbi:hypothetical protein [Caenispirillum bisanense]|uniref:DUF2383 domain-containing protein n=1 Tax=Caenispirillum bisanense TaxID=414052 RepID=A0A286GZ03_9PROT|nr:hypothetical protein [Caenispirillum bisanense]SOE00436.1 hypothetical protein SAMN05421508_11293 [Caenispirillum bisanense]